MGWKWSKIPGSKTHWNRSKSLRIMRIETDQNFWPTGLELIYKKTDGVQKINGSRKFVTKMDVTMGVVLTGFNRCYNRCYEKFLSQKNVWVRKMFGQKRFWVKKKLGLNNFGFN